MAGFGEEGRRRQPGNVDSPWPLEKQGNGFPSRVSRRNTPCGHPDFSSRKLMLESRPADLDTVCVLLWASELAAIWEEQQEIQLPSKEPAADSSESDL